MPFNKIFHNNIRLAAVGKGIASPPDEVPRFVKIKLQCYRKGQSCGLAGLVVRIVADFREVLSVKRTSPNVTNLTVHTAPILLGSLHGESINELEPLADAIVSSGIPAETSVELEKALWAKMLYNTTLNPLGAILNMTYGQL